ncbi:Imm49 family immunity protein [Streptomyces sp. NPDC003042]
MRLPDRRPGAPSRRTPRPVPLGKPDAAERARTAEQLDAAGTLTPDQRLLRVLLDDDQAAFEQALEERLVAHRESVGADPAAGSLLPVGARHAGRPCLSRARLAVGHPVRLSARSAGECPAAVRPCPTW